MHSGLARKYGGWEVSRLVVGVCLRASDVLERDSHAVWANQVASGKDGVRCYSEKPAYGESLSR